MLCIVQKLFWDNIRGNAHAFTLHFLAALSLVGSFSGWTWVQGVFDGWFPAFCVITAELVRVKKNQAEGIVEKVHSGMQKLALSGVLAILLIGTAALLYVQHVLELVERRFHDETTYQVRFRAGEGE